jgi:hypothetical protein
VRFAPELAGPRDPVRSTTRRAPGSVRRTTTIDVRRPEGLPGPSSFDARGRDLATPRHGDPVVVSAAAFTVHLDVMGILGPVEPAPACPPPEGLALAGLCGASLATGFRRTLAAASVPSADPGGLWHQLLDDLVGARVVSGIAQQYEETLAGHGPMHEGIYANTDALFEHQGGICAGWAVDATMLRELEESGHLPVPVGPEAPELEAGDPMGWHEHAAMEPHAVRRRRRLDLGPADEDGVAPLDVHFRDSHCDGDGVERVVHEYALTGAVDTGAGVLTGLAAASRVLPWPECPAAEASVERVVGLEVATLRDHVRHELRGVSTCTHLKDVLRSLADLGRLAAALP